MSAYDPADGTPTLNMPTCAPTQRPMVAVNGSPAATNFTLSRLYEKRATPPSPITMRR